MGAQSQVRSFSFFCSLLGIIAHPIAIKTLEPPSLEVTHMWQRRCPAGDREGRGWAFGRRAPSYVSGTTTGGTTVEDIGLDGDGLGGARRRFWRWNLGLLLDGRRCSATLRHNTTHHYHIHSMNLKLDNLLIQCLAHNPDQSRNSSGLHIFWSCVRCWCHWLWFSGLSALSSVPAEPSGARLSNHDQVLKNTKAFWGHVQLPWPK